MSSRAMDCWRWLPLVLLASVWTPACQRPADRAGYDAPGVALDHGAQAPGGAPDDAEPSLCETVCADLAPAGTPESTRSQLQWCLDHCSVTSLRAGEVFGLSESIVVPSGKTLTTAGASGTLADNNWAELRETADPNRRPVAFGSRQLVTVCSQATATGDSEGCASGSPSVGGTLRHLTLNANNQSDETTPSSVINVEGRGNLIEFVLVVYPVLERATPIAECSLQSRWGPVDRFTAIAFDDLAVAGKSHRAQPVVEGHPGPGAVDFGLAYDVVPIGWTGESATD
jgi:hypothetical protein